MRPPTIASRILAWSLSDDDREHVLGDFEEEYEAQLERHGRARADAWYRRQVASSIVFNVCRRGAPSAPAIPKDSFMTTSWLDIRYALRQLRRAPGFSVPAVLTLALGIGAATAIYTVVDRVVLRPLPYADADRLVRLWDRNEEGGLLQFSVSPGNYLEWRRASRTLESVGAYREDGFTLATPEGGERIDGARTTASLLEVLRVQPVAGRVFLPDEDRPNGAPVAILTSSLASRFGDPASMVGRSLTIDGRAHEIVGVLPRDFQFPQQPAVQVLVPYALNEASPERRAHFLRVLGRMKPAVTVDRTRTELAGIAGELQRTLPESNKGWSVTLLPLHTAVVGDVRQTLLLLLGAAALLLVITCANVAGLLLARSQGREPELAMRAALGAGGGRLARQLVTESLVLSAIGGVAGAALARVGVSTLLAIRPDALPRAAEVAMDARTFVFVAGICAATGLLFGVLPWMVHSRRVELRDAVAGAGRTPRRTGRAARRVLVASEIALALSIGVGAVLLVQHFVGLQRIDPGFATKGVLSMALRPPAGAYDDPKVRMRLYRAVMERLETVPGAAAAGAAHRLPLAGNSSLPFAVVGRPTDGAPVPNINYRALAGDYFGALRMPLLQGRMFTDAEMWESGGAVIVNRAAVDRYLNGADPLTQRISGPAKSTLTIVGVVENVREGALDAAPEPAMYLPYSAYPVPGMTLVIRSEQEAAPLARPAIDAVRQIDPALAPGQVQTLDAFLREAMAGPRFSAVLLSLFAAIALALAAVGVYAVTSFTVAQQTPEIGVRVALGATPRDVFRAVVLPGLRLAAAGTVAGLLCAALAARLMGGLLLGVDARQPAVFAATAVGLFMVAGLATLVPAVRAMRINPIIALRR